MQEDIKCFENTSVEKKESECKVEDSMHSLYTISHVLENFPRIAIGQQIRPTQLSSNEFGQDCKSLEYNIVIGHLQS